MTNMHWAPGTGYWALGTGHWALGTSYWVGHLSSYSVMPLDNAGNCYTLLSWAGHTGTQDEFSSGDQ